MPDENAIPDTLEMPSKTEKFGVGTVGTLLVFAAVVQYNDPDPYAWLVLYLAAAGVSFAALWFPDLWKLPAVVAVGAFIWAATLVPTVTQTSFPDLFQSWEMMSREMEEGREFWGLLSVASWTTYLVHRGRKTQQ
jgi:hypothetical protein|tara:strand:+ start:179 stop:583 length:405 start_codon:yes stop_codon:yes gene_type:complete